MEQTLTREIECSNCGLRTRHLDSNLLEIEERQSAWRVDAREINYACPECSTLTRSRLVLGSTLILALDGAKRLCHPRPWLVCLECAGKGCESPVILLAPTKGETPDDDMTEWKNVSALCTKGHSPREPFDYCGAVMPRKFLPE